MRLIKVESHEEMSQYVCGLIKRKLTDLPSPVLGLATGLTPERLYELLVEEYKSGQLSFAHATTFNLDEYIGLPKNHQNSYHHYMNAKLFNHVDILKDKINIPDGMAADMQAECLDYDRRIKEVNGIDLQILGIGLNGHIGFNEPGTSFLSNTHIVDLDYSTRQANRRFFNTMEEVPAQAVTMGINTIMQSREVVLMIVGKRKAEVLKRLFYEDVTESFPASILRKHPNVKVIADKAALSLVNNDVISFSI